MSHSLRQSSVASRIADFREPSLRGTNLLNYAVTAIGSLSAGAVIRSLRHLDGARIVGLNCYPANWTPASALVDNFYQLPMARDRDAFVERLLALCETEHVDYVIPLTDPEVDALSSDLERFASIGTQLCLAPESAITTCRDKWLAYKAFANEGNVALIPTLLLHDAHDAALPFPLIAKPRNGRSSEDVFIIHDSAALAYHRSRPDTRDHIVQPYLDGHVCTVDVVRQQATGRTAAMARKELLRTSNGAGLVVEMLDDARLIDASRRIAEKLGINGCINIEFLLHDDRALLLDINPRFSAGVAFSHMAGYDMVGNHLRCFGGAPIEVAARPAKAFFARHYTEIEMPLPAEVDHAHAT